MNKQSILLCLMMLFALNLEAATRVNVVGLFNGKAVVMINGGSPQTMSVGQTKQEVKLLAADSQKATFIIEGKTQVLGMGQAAAVAGAATTEPNTPVKLFADTAGHFFGNMVINGATLRYVVDTGATSVGMNSADAKFAKIDYLSGQKTQVSTASGLSPAYVVKLNTLKIGTITLNNVEALVIEGGYPDVVLLGMSALNRMEMKRENSVMTLIKKY